MGKIDRRNDYVLEYSAEQRAFHVQPLEEALAANARRFWHKPTKPLDWVPVYQGTYRQCEIMAKQMSSRLEREEQKAEGVSWVH